MPIFEFQKLPNFDFKYVKIKFAHCKFSMIEKPEIGHPVVDGYELFYCVYAIASTKFPFFAKNPKNAPLCKNPYSSLET